MKFLIDNYSDSEQTQPLYLQQGLRSLGQEAYISDISHVSVFDLFDITQPEIYISSIERVSNAVIQYLKQSDIRMILNVNNKNLKEVKEATEFLQNNELAIEFYITDNYNFPNKINNTRVVKLAHAADINEVKDLDFNYHIGKAIFIHEVEKEMSYKTSFHVMSTNHSIEKSVDICLPCVAMRPLFSHYDEVIFKNLKSINQMFLTCLCSGVKTYYDNTKLENIDEQISAMMGESFNLNYRSDNRLGDFSEISSIVSKKHVGINRAKTLLSQVKGK